MLHLLRKKIGEDSSRVLTNIFLSFLIKGGALIVSLLTTPIYIKYFNNNSVLGVWFVVLSILTWILQFDFGIGNGLRNRLVENLEKKDEEKCKKYISSAYFVILLLVIVIFIIFLIINNFLPWNIILGVSNEELDIAVIRTSMLIVSAGICLQMLLQLINSISYAFQRSFVPGLMVLITNTLLLLYALIANNFGFNGSIINLSISYSLSVNVPLLIMSLFFFLGKNKVYFPKISYFDIKYAIDTIKLGGAFLYLQLIALLINGTSNVLISFFLGSEQVVDYQLYYKLYHIVVTAVSVALTPMWSAITKAYNNKKYDWLKKSMTIMLVATIICFAVELLIVPFQQFAFDIWLREESIKTEITYGFVFAISAAMFIWQMVCCYISNGLGKLKIQAIFMTVGAVIYLISSYFLSKAMGSYVAIAISMSIAYFPFCVIQTIWIIKFCRELSKLSKENETSVENEN